MIMLFSQEITPGSDEDMHIVTKSKQDVTESNNECFKFCRTVQCSDSLSLQWFPLSYTMYQLSTFQVDGWDLVASFDGSQEVLT